MQRRKFLAATTAAALPFALGATPDNPTAPERQLIELRTYEVKFRGSGRGVLMDYLNDALLPALKRHGVPTVRIMRELGNADPAKVWVLIAYPDAATYVACQNLDDDAQYRTATETYDTIAPDRPVYNRFTAQLLQGFKGMPAVDDPGDDAGLFELRTYEGYSEDAVRRKIAMFDDEEIDLFLRVGLHPVFFGKMIAGPYRPCLVYMLHFKDMEERNANWATFSQHPDWKRMVAEEKYANTVSNIRKQFLVPA